MDTPAARFAQGEIVMTRTLWACAFAGLLLATAALAASDVPTSASSQKSIKHGEFLVGYGGCNDCHTPGWGEHGGQAPRDRLLTGGGLAFQGPWGTTYPTNLRLFVDKLSLQQWVHAARTMKARPLMPWWTFRYLSDADLADMYHYIRSLGPAGQPAHAYVAPGQDAPAPYMRMVLPTAPPQVAGTGQH
jgi:mono/diheme cytochrome c family protein